jgi:hypothetical protein
VVRCYDCGQKIPDNEIVRRTVQTGASETTWKKGQFGPPRSTSSRTYHRKVNLCPDCAASRKKAKHSKEGITKSGCVKAVIVAGLLCFGGILSHRDRTSQPASTPSTQPASAPTNQTASTPAVAPKLPPGRNYSVMGEIVGLHTAYKRISLKHRGIPGLLAPGQTSFHVDAKAVDVVYPGGNSFGRLYVGQTERFLGQKITLAVEQRYPESRNINNQWVAVRIITR